MINLSSSPLTALSPRLQTSQTGQQLAAILPPSNTSTPIYPRAASPSTQTHSSEPSRWIMSLLGLKTLRPKRHKASTAMWDAWHSIQRSHFPSMAAPSGQACIKSHQEIEKLLKSSSLLATHPQHTTTLYFHRTQTLHTTRPNLSSNSGHTRYHPPTKL